MVIPGRVVEGVVVFDGDVRVPEGTRVTVVVAAAPSEVSSGLPSGERGEGSDAAGGISDTKSEGWNPEDARAALKQILELPNENPDDRFSGADHDRALYGETE